MCTTLVVNEESVGVDEGLLEGVQDGDGSTTGMMAVTTTELGSEIDNRVSTGQAEDGMLLPG